MRIFNWLTDMFGIGDHSSSISDDSLLVNPANGLPMINGMGGVDVEGNPFGTDFSHDHIVSSCFDDSFTSISSFDDNNTSISCFDDSQTHHSSFDDSWN